MFVFIYYKQHRHILIPTEVEHISFQNCISGFQTVFIFSNSSILVQTNSNILSKLITSLAFITNLPPISFKIRFTLNSLTISFFVYTSNIILTFLKNMLFDLFVLLIIITSKCVVVTKSYNIYTDVSHTHNYM